MAKLRVTIIDEVRNRRLKVDPPDDAVMEKLLPALAKKLGLPATEPDGQPVTYRLIHEASSTPIPLVTQTAETRRTATAATIFIQTAQTPTSTPKPTWTPTSTTSPTLPTSSAVISGTWLFDLENARPVPLSEHGYDLWWQQVDSETRYIVPRSGAQFAVMGPVDFDTMDCSSAPYSSNKIDRSIYNNQIPDGTVLCAKTRNGMLVKMRIDEYGYSLEVTIAYP
jgi:hypothetical protein